MCTKTITAKLVICVGITTLMVFVGAPQIEAVSFTETEDVGDLPRTALTLAGGGNLQHVDTISGRLSSGSDVDMYKVALTNRFAIETVFSRRVPPGINVPIRNVFDTQLFLFHSREGPSAGVLDGFGAWFNDDIAQGNMRSKLTAADIEKISGERPFGNHYLAISRFNRDPIGSAGAIFPDRFPGIFPPNPGLSLDATIVTGWTGGTGGGNYRIQLSGVLQVGDPTGQPIPTPESGGLSLLAIGLFALLSFSCFGSRCVWRQSLRSQPGAAR